jgi:hypothetical protein
MSEVRSSSATTALSAQDAETIGVEAYVYLYPLVLMELTRRQMTNAPVGSKPGFGPIGEFVHVREFPPADFKAVVRPNFDTLYSVAWLDLTGGPMVVSTADTGGRYYMLPLLDMWTDVFAVPGGRTTGTQAADFAVAPAGWDGTVPEGMEVIHAPTSYVWIIGRTQTNGPADYDAVHAVQDGYTITPLSNWGQDPEPIEPKTDPTVDIDTPPLDQVNGMSAGEYFRFAAELLKLHAPHVTDWSTVARIARIGICPGESFDFDGLDRSLQSALEGVPVAARARLTSTSSTTTLASSSRRTGYPHRAGRSASRCGYTPQPPKRSTGGGYRPQRSACDRAVHPRLGRRPSPGRGGRVFCRCAIWSRGAASPRGSSRPREGSGR